MGKRLETRPWLWVYVGLQYRNIACSGPLVNRAVVLQTCTSGLLKPGTLGIPFGTLDKFLAKKENF